MVVAVVGSMPWLNLFVGIVAFDLIELLAVCTGFDVFDTNYSDYSVQPVDES